MLQEQGENFVDANLVARCLEGDREALLELIRAHEKMVYGIAYRTLGDPEEARDAAQEVFLKVLESLPYFRGESKLSTWIYRIALNECSARIKRSRMRAEVALPEVPDSGPSALEAMEEEERNRLLRSAVAGLPKKYRRVVVLHYFEGLSYEEVAEVLLLPVGTVKARLFRARKMLRKKLGRLLR